LNSPKNISASVRARLLNIARDRGADYNLILSKYAMERLLYRLSISHWAESFLLKGALLFDIWFDQPHRPTRDIDLLGFGSSELADVIAIFREVCTIAYEDGMMFNPRTVQASEIRKEANYAGVRVTLLGKLDGARCSVQIDVGYGDTVTPAPEQINYPVLLDDMDAPVLRSYPSYTVGKVLSSMSGYCARQFLPRLLAEERHFQKIYPWACPMVLRRMPQKHVNGARSSIRISSMRPH